MKVHRFFLTFKKTSGKLLVEDGETLKLMHTVLHLAPGETVEFFDGTGTVLSARIEKISRSSCELDILSTRQENPPRRLSMYASVLKKDSYEWMIQKCTEIGVTEFVPVITRRTVKTGIHKERMEQIAREAAEQSNRAFVPTIHEPMPFEETLNRLKKEKTIMCDGTGDLFEDVADAKEVENICIGPEGGFSDEEKEWARKAGVPIVRIVQTVLRAETAAIVAAYRCLYM